MKFSLLALMAIALPLCAAADVTGKWTGSIDITEGDGGKHETACLILKQDGTTLTGTGGPTEEQQMPIQKGKVDGNKITFEIALDQDRVMSFTLQAEADSITGDVSGSDKETGQPKTAKLSLNRVTAK